MKPLERVVVVAAILFLHLPVLALGVFSFSKARLSASFDGPSLVWYEKLLGNRPLLIAIENSLVVGLVTTVIVLALATMAALGLRAADRRTTERVSSVFLMPLVTPEIVLGVALLLFFARFELPLGLPTVVTAHVVFTLSFAFAVLRARILALPPGLTEAAIDLGATPAQAFCRVTLPLLGPGLVAAGLLTFSLSIDDYVVTSFVAGPGATTLPVYVYSLLKSSLSPEIAAASTLLLVATTLLLVASALFETRRKTATAALCAGLLVLVAPIAVARVSPSVDGKGGSERPLNLYLWSNYIAPETIRKFEARAGARVNLDVFDSAEALLSRMLATNPGYDVISPPTYILGPLRTAGALETLDLARLPHLPATDTRFLAQNWDRENRFSIPYLWGITGIAWDARDPELRENAGASWRVLFEPGRSPSPRILMLDDAREAVATAAFVLGLDPNTRDRAALKRIQSFLLDQKPLVKAYNSASFDDALLAGDVRIAQAWSGQIAKAMREASWLRFAVPREGAMMFVDTLAIPRGARDPFLAHEFLDFVLEPEIAAEISRTTGYSTPSREGRALLPAELRDHPAMFPDDAALSRLRTFEDLGTDAALYDRLWTEVKAGRLPR
jgi:spermidine/putrescine transport system permease protein